MFEFYIKWYYYCLYGNDYSKKKYVKKNFFFFKFEFCKIIVNYYVYKCLNNYRWYENY